jgi:hypothetical protein
MRALVWIVEDTWQAAVAEAAVLLPPDADVTLLHVEDAESESVVRAARHALLGRARPRAHEGAEPLLALSAQAAAELLDEALRGLGRPARLQARRGRVEREVVAAAEAVDILVLARDGDREHLGPRSLGPAARFVVDHAPCRVLLIWPDAPPSVATIPPPRGAGDPAGAGDPPPAPHS